MLLKCFLTKISFIMYNKMTESLVLFLYVSKYLFKYYTKKPSNSTYTLNSYVI